MPHKRTAITLYALIMISVSAALFTASAKAAGVRSYKTTIHTKPGAVLERTSGKLDPSVESFSYLAVKLDGRPVPYSEKRGCEADITSRRVLITIDTCGDRIRVHVASTGKTSRVVRVEIR